MTHRDAKPYVLLIAALGAACGGSGAEPVPIVAGPGDMAQLHGEWKGVYEAPAVGRSGSIVFRLEAGADTAEGDVVMIPDDLGSPLQPADFEPGGGRPATTQQVLRIAFVRIQGGKVSGTLQPYRDPECECSVYTTFTGELDGDIITGEFRATRDGGGGPFTGTWSVRRAQP